MSSSLQFFALSPLSPSLLIADGAAISSPHVAGDTCCFNYFTVRAGFVKREREREKGNSRKGEFQPSFSAGYNDTW